ncbi:hypothetical protein [Roseivirga pacifica]
MKAPLTKKKLRFYLLLCILLTLLIYTWYNKYSFKQAFYKSSFKGEVLSIQYKGRGLYHYRLKGVDKVIGINSDDFPNYIEPHEGDSIVKETESLELKIFRRSPNGKFHLFGQMKHY